MGRLAIGIPINAVLPLHDEGNNRVGQTSKGLDADIRKKDSMKQVKQKEKRDLLMKHKLKLKNINFLDTFDDIESEFTSAETTMPCIPYNLDIQYTFITWRARFVELKNFPTEKS